MNEFLEKPAKVIAISKNENIITAAAKMRAEKISCLIVNDENGRPAGLLTERDIANCVAISPNNLKNTTVGQIMTDRIVSCPPDTPTSIAREIMTSHGIRHLPIVDGDTVVGIYSARDLMQQQLLEDRAAAKEVAMLSACLKSIDLNEAAEIVTKEVPKIFQAGKCSLCLFKDDAKMEIPSLSCLNECLCPAENLFCIAPVDSFPPSKIIIGETSEEENFTYDILPEHCVKAGAKGPRLVIPLTISGYKGNRNGTSASSFMLGKTKRGNFVDIKDKSPAQNDRMAGYLCMCGLENKKYINRELICYKAKLTKEILTSHLTNASLYQRARLTSLTDALTGAGSRKLLEDRLQAEAARAKRYQRPFSVAIIDLDNFKTINDVLGHSTGDEALKKLAACMKQQKRTPDVLARYGGDEFVILMPETKAEDAFTLMERIRSEIQKLHIAENISMTVSCGIAQGMPENNDGSGDVIRRADLALYEAKSNGRNCVRLWNKNMSKLLNPDDIEIEKIKKLKRRVAGLSEQAEIMFIQSIWGFVQALEAKDPYVRRHSENVMYYSIGIAQALELTGKKIETIRRAAMIHDIGKIGVPDAVIAKPGVLTQREKTIIEQHPLIAVRILEKMSFLEDEVAIIRGHHEKWNGHGYPDGLSKTSIPIGSRILAVADSLEALTSSRPYHKSRTLDDAVEIILDASDYDFDPDVVKGLLSWIVKVQKQTGKIEKITTEDLIESIKKHESGSSTESSEQAVNSAIGV
ncbi:MAG: diguanylate cyclase [Sedimentisphaerales bacterium]|nr:diguanylate cyclase [Sedimentisphaerales bacterium]